MQSTLLRKTEQCFADVGITSARLDAELLMAQAMGVERSYLHAHSEERLDDATRQRFEQLVARRLKREPLAYIVGHKEFYGREFAVTPDVLIPRPETERLIEFVLRNIALGATILEVGTGSGAIAITLALELAKSQVTATDISASAITLAKKNANSLSAVMTLTQSDLLNSVSGKFDLIVANLPYVDPDWPASPETRFEPALALFADDNGLALIKRLMLQATKHLPIGGTLLLELDTRQLTETMAFAEHHGYSVTETGPFLLALKKL